MKNVIFFLDFHALNHVQDFCVYFSIPGRYNIIAKFVASPHYFCLLLKLTFIYFFNQSHCDEKAEVLEDVVSEDYSDNAWCEQLFK